ncbi:bifunctional diguanylate cyclase/phosphodiesterase [Mycolicibacterium sphagni]|nr:sensor domain-containing diguanylate cyclase [Mycolicibacterium sphagni]
MAAAAGFVGLPSDGGIVILNAVGEIMAASAGAQDILGLSLAQLRGRTSQDPRWAVVDELGQLVEGAHAPAAIALRTRTAVRGRILGVHRPRSDPAGYYAWVHVDAVPLVHASGPAPWAVVIAVRPVRGEQRQALELRASERLFRMIAEHSSDMVAWQLLPDTTFLWVSPAARTVLGVDPDFIIGTACIGLVHPDDRAGLAKSWCAAADVPPKPTVRMQHADGSYRWVEITAHVLPHLNRKPQQMITAYRDVSDRVIAERARDAAVRSFELAMSSSTIGVAWPRRNGTLGRVNPALSRILGRSVDELLGHSLREFAADDDWGLDDPLVIVQTESLGYHESERRFVRPDGTEVWCQYTVIGLRDESDAITNCLLQLQDITAQKTATAQLEQLAVTDPLTGLPNRTVLGDRLTRALDEARNTGTSVGVLFIDLDRFKDVNDTLGHDAGDGLLCEVGIRLTTVVRHTDTVVRLGGDEFVVVREQLSSATELDDLADRINDIFAAPFVINGNPLRVYASIGRVAAGGTFTADQLLSEADEAMYRAKRSGRPR